MNDMGETRGRGKSLSRREVLKRISVASMSAPILNWGKLPFSLVLGEQQGPPSAPPSRLMALSPEDDLFLEELERPLSPTFGTRQILRPVWLKTDATFAPLTTRWWPVSPRQASV